MSELSMPLWPSGKVRKNSLLEPRDFLRHVDFSPCVVGGLTLTPHSLRHEWQTVWSGLPAHTGLCLVHIEYTVMLTSTSYFKNSHTLWHGCCILWLWGPSGVSWKQKWHLPCHCCSHSTFFCLCMYQLTKCFQFSLPEFYSMKHTLGRHSQESYSCSCKEHSFIDWHVTLFTHH